MENAIKNSIPTRNMKRGRNNQNPNQITIDKSIKRKQILRGMLRNKYLYIMTFPGIIFFLVFRYIPMGGLIIAFQNYQPFLGIDGSPWVGTAHFRRLFMEGSFTMLMRNTLMLFFLGTLTFPLPIILALSLNEVKNKWFKSIVQTIVYIPHFMSWVIVVSMFFIILSVDRGLINEVISFFGGDRIHFMTNPAWARTIYIIQDTWKGIGWSSIIFLAAITNVDTTLYEAAQMDGANRWRQTWHVTLPAIRPTIVTLLILRVGNTLDIGFEHVFLITNAMNRHVLDIFDTFVFRMGIHNGQFSFATAVGLFRGVVGLILVIGANKLAKWFGEDGIY